MEKTAYIAQRLEEIKTTDPELYNDNVTRREMVEIYRQWSAMGKTQAITEENLDDFEVNAVARKYEIEKQDLLDILLGKNPGKFMDDAAWEAYLLEGFEG